MELAAHAELNIGNMTIAQLLKLQRWWFAQGRTLQDIDKPHLVKATGIRVNPDEDTIFSNGRIVMDDVSKRVTMDGKPVHITPCKFRILKYFIRHCGLCLSVKEACKGIWGYHNEVSHQLLRVHIGELRAILGKDCIETRRGYGYIMHRR